MKKGMRWAMGLLGMLLLLAAEWQLGAAARGLTTTRLRTTEPALTILAPEASPVGTRPLALVGHGFAASSVIMRGFAFTLAHAGYNVVLWDFNGHGTNPRPLRSDPGDEGSLLANAETAAREALAAGFGDPAQVAILGHSMGSGVALDFGLQHPDTRATIAISPVTHRVTADLPHNLLLLAGSLEAPFVQNARELLDQAGGPGGDPALGSARQLTIIPNVEHISILFLPTTHHAAREWLDATFGPQPGAQTYTDRRLIWYGAGVLGALLLAAALASLSSPALPASAVIGPSLTLGRRLIALAGGALGATLVLWLTSRVGLDLSEVLGLVVGGYLLLWFGVAGLLGLLILGYRPRWPSRRDLLAGLLIAAALWVGVGWLGRLVWLPWLLIPQRLVLWPLGVGLLLPWFLAVAEALPGIRLTAQAGRWLVHSLVVVTALILALILNPELYFLILILPLFPMILVLHAVASAAPRRSWSFALSGALFTSWLLLAVFPLV